MTRIRATSVLSGIGWLAALVACSSGQEGMGDRFGSQSSEAEDSYAELDSALGATPTLLNAGVAPGLVGTSDATSTLVASVEVPPDPAFLTPLPIPPVLAPTSSDANGDSYSIAIRPGLAQMKAGAATPIVGFDGIAPGPTIVATRGRAVQVTQSNDWTENVTVHNHGHKVAASSDGHPTDYIAPGQSKVFSYPNDQNAGTYWYHDHTMDLTGPHVYQGLAGFYIIRDAAEDALGLPSGAFDIPLLIQDKTFNSDNSLNYEHDFFFGFLGDTAVVNGAVTPHLDVGTRKYRFRVLNGSNARPLALELHAGGSTAAEAFQVIASDGGLLAAPVELSVLPVAPAERYDVVVDFSKYPVGTKLDLVTAPPADLGALGLGDSAAPGVFGPTGEGIVLGPVSAGGLIPSGVAPASEPLPVMQFVVDRSEVDSSSVPSQLARVERLNPADAVSEQSIVFRFDGEDWTLNDQKYDPERIDVSSRLDQVNIWSLTNESAVPHPFHKHLSLFNVLDIDGAPPPSFMSGWKDTVMVPPGAKVRIVFKDETFTGTYVFHCHNLEHEDHGMMGQEQVEP